MKTSIKFLVATVLLLQLSLTVYAQRTYQYAVVDFFPTKMSLEVSIDGSNYTRTQIDRDNIKGLGDVNPGLKKVNEMCEQGWELFNTSTSGNGESKSYTFFLRKKI